MRLEVKANSIRPGDLIWFSGDRKPSTVVSVTEQQGAEKLVVLNSENGTIWYLNYETGKVYQYYPDPPDETMEEQYLDPDGNPT